MCTHKGLIPINFMNSNSQQVMSSETSSGMLASASTSRFQKEFEHSSKVSQYFHSAADCSVVTLSFNFTSVFVLLWISPTTLSVCVRVVFVCTAGVAVVALLPGLHTCLSPNLLN